MSRQQENYGAKQIFLWILVLIMIAVIFFILHSSLFNVTDISVFGCERFSSQDIINACGIDYDTNIIAVDKEQAKINIEQNAYLQVESIKRTFPTGIEIYIKERTPIAEIGTVDGYYIIDEACNALSVNEASDETLISVLNMGIMKPVFGTPVTSDNEGKTDAVKAVLSSAKKYSILERITSVDVEDPENIIIYYDETVKVYFSSSVTVDKKMAYLENTVDAVRDKLTDGKALHMENEGGYYIK